MKTEVYQNFVARKLAYHESQGIDDSWLDASSLFPHQDALSRWALRKGKAAIFANTGLGKTRMQLTWADAVRRATGGDVLILAPLAVAEQTREEGMRIGVTVTHAREADDIRPGVNITNYDRLHRFDASRFVGVVLDESSRIKHDDSKTLGILMDAFGSTPYKLCATATPAPNDWTELGTHAQFLGVCTVAEMLAEFFVHDGGETQVWRLKGHARDAFWKWVASWGAMIQSPADLGFDASAYDLPPLHTQQITVESDAQAQDGMLFAMEAQTLSDRRQAKRDSMIYRVRECAKLVHATWAKLADCDNEQSEFLSTCGPLPQDREGQGSALPELQSCAREVQGRPRKPFSSNSVPLTPFLIWCELNDEQNALEKVFGDLAFSVRGSDKPEIKEDRIIRWMRQERPIMISKAKILGWGLNFQFCHNMIFLGATDSFEGYYQAVRRCWRFGQTQAVNVFIFASEYEGAILRNLQRKEADAMAMFQALSAETAAAVRDEVMGQKRQHNHYVPAVRMKLPSFLKAINILEHAA